MSDELKEAVQEYFKILGYNTPSHSNPDEPHFPIYHGCSLPHPARENLNKVLDRMKLLADVDPNLSYFRGTI